MGNFTCFGWCLGSSNPSDDVFSEEEDGSAGWRQASLIVESDDDDSLVPLPTWSKAGSVVPINGVKLSSLARTDSLSEVEVGDFAKRLGLTKAADAPPMYATDAFCEVYYSL